MFLGPYRAGLRRREVVGNLLFTPLSFRFRPLETTSPGGIESAYYKSDLQEVNRYDHQARYAASKTNASCASATGNPSRYTAASGCASTQRGSTVFPIQPECHASLSPPVWQPR
jgi:hypothetical protein